MPKIVVVIPFHLKHFLSRKTKCKYDYTLCIKMQKIQHTIFIWSLLCGCIQHALFGCTFRRAVMSITEPWLGSEKRQNIMIQLYLLSEVRFCKCGVYLQCTWSICVISQVCLSLSFRDCGGVPSHKVQDKVIFTIHEKMNGHCKFKKKKSYQVLSDHNHWRLTDNLVIQFFLGCPPCSYSVLCYNGNMVHTWCTLKLLDNCPF